MGLDVHCQGATLGSQMWRPGAQAVPIVTRPATALGARTGVEPWYPRMAGTTSEGAGHGDACQGPGAAADGAHPAATTEEAAHCIVADNRAGAVRVRRRRVVALVTCPECSKRVSDQASACPGCGFPIAGRATTVSSRDDNVVSTTLGFFDWLDGYSLKKGNRVRALQQAWMRCDQARSGEKGYQRC